MCDPLQLFPLDFIRNASQPFGSLNAALILARDLHSDCHVGSGEITVGEQTRAAKLCGDIPGKYPPLAREGGKPWGSSFVIHHCDADQVKPRINLAFGLAPRR